MPIVSEATFQSVRRKRLRRAGPITRPAPIIVVPVTRQRAKGVAMTRRRRMITSLKREIADGLQDAFVRQQGWKPVEELPRRLVSLSRCDPRKCARRVPRMVAGGGDQMGYLVELSSMEEGVLGAGTGAGAGQLGTPPVQPIPPQLDPAIAGRFRGGLEELEPDLLSRVGLDDTEDARGEPLTDGLDVDGAEDAFGLDEAADHLKKLGGRTEGEGPARPFHQRAFVAEVGNRLGAEQLLDRFDVLE